MESSVQVLSCPLDVDEQAWLELTASLSAAERAEGDERRDELDRRRFLAARGWRRRVLAAELGCEPAETPIAARPGGKPYLDGRRLRFSASRSGAQCLIACSWEMEVGVDIEAVDPATDVERFARRFFTAAEQRGLAGLPPPQRHRALYACWSRKEAYLKGTGEGLDVPTASIEVWAGDDRPVTVGGWRIHAVAVDPGFQAAVAGENTGMWRPSSRRQQL